MTTEAALREALERWPGYDEQSWRQRFIELDRRYRAMEDRLAAFERAAIQAMSDAS